MSLLHPSNPNPNSSPPPPPPPSAPSLQWHRLATGEVSSPLSDPLHPYRFQRSDQWKPVYSWLESLDFDRLVNTREITEWLDANPRVYELLLVKHSRYHLMHYIQRLHLKVLKKKGKVHKAVQLSAARASLKLTNGSVTTHAVPLRSKPPVNELKDDQMSLDKKSEAFLRYELLTDLQSRLNSVLFNSEHAANLNFASSSSSFPKHQCDDNAGYQPLGVSDDTKIISGNAPHASDVVNIHVAQQPRISFGDTMDGQGNKWDPVIQLPAWSYNEATSVAGLTGTFKTDQSSSSNCQEAGAEIIEAEDAHFSMSQKSSSKKNIAIYLQGREKGCGWPLTCLHSGYAGRNREHWTPFLKGWRSLERQFEGPAVWFERRRYSSWVPTWRAYTSHAASAQPHGRQGVQRVLDVRFHPDGLPQLVCSCNEAPNELLLYNLLSGRAVQLNGHNCQIQAAEFAVRGASVVSCGANLLKVWDCTTGSCLFTLGSVGDDRTLVGHTKRINAMTVNTWQSCLVATSGGSGDDKVLLWNALRGELAVDLNVNLRDKNQSLPSIEAMDFCNENLLACGSDCSHGAPAVVQLWDLESQSCLSFPAHDYFITSVKTNPAGSTIITGAGDGTVCLFDIRTCDATSRLSVGSVSEVTSASFSSCGTYFHASSTSNKTMVWDTRLMPMNRGQRPLEKTSWGMHFMRPLHCLSHGKQMPTAEYSGQLPGHVDEGAQGVNDACWLYKEPALVTVSGDGSIAMWDVTLGQPCVRRIVSHMRCANTVTVSANDEYLCSGGDDQKVVLYHNSRGRSNRRWRLSHPMA